MTRVIKVGGRPLADPAFATEIADVWDALSAAMVLVHGGGDDISALQHQLGFVPQFVDGRRVTTAQDMELVRMALSGTANKRLVSALVREGVRAVGVSGEDASLIAAMPVETGRLGHVGTPQKINTSLLLHLIDGGFLPVVSPVSRNVGHELGPALNVNADDAAAAIAIAMEAEELVIVSDVPGVLVDEAPLATLTINEARGLMQDGRAAGGMRAKLSAAVDAVHGGVKRVRIGDLRTIADATRGTIVQNKAE
ncbi:MAG TPA: acetylglutamate kinase [Gemmatimonadaceae bacterium]|nr:acetylglutamate kinase [Gemmatimonadaceae bacterium]